ASLDAAAEKYKAANSNLVYDAYFMLGLNYYHLKNYGEALKNFEHVLDEYPEEPEAKKIAEEIKRLLDD
ncbi:MAG: tetratricopeptide repeat protein, partial [Helicobacteraceae bacterium]|nr:tetratricopeptide repeat protein [Helicobacteraceae bacterium]